MNEFSSQLPSILDQIIASIPAFKPELALIVAFVAAIIATLFCDKIWKYSSLLVTVLGVLTSISWTIAQKDVASSAFFGMLVIDNFAVYARVIIQIAILIIIALIQQYCHNKSFHKNIGDVYSILLAAGFRLCSGCRKIAD